MCFSSIGWSSILKSRRTRLRRYSSRALCRSLVGLSMLRNDRGRVVGGRTGLNVDCGGGVQGVMCLVCGRYGLPCESYEKAENGEYENPE
jgi:hypothetical protein